MRNYWTEELPIKRWADKKSAGSRIVTIQMVKFVLAQELKKSKSRYDGGENQSSKLLCGNWVSNDKIAKALNYVGDTIAAGVEEIFAKFPDAQAVGFSMDNFTHGSAELWMLYYMYGKTVITKPLLPEPDDRTFLSAIDWAFSVFIEALFFQDKSDSFGIGVLLNPRLGLPIEAGNTENESDSSDPEDLLDAGAGDLPEEPVLHEPKLITNSLATKGVICTTSGSGGTAPICGGGGGAPGESRNLHVRCYTGKIPQYLAQALSAWLMITKDLQPHDMSYSDCLNEEYVRAVTHGIGTPGRYHCQSGVVYMISRNKDLSGFQEIVGLVLGNEDGTPNATMTQLQELKIVSRDCGPSTWVDWDLLASYRNEQSGQFELIHNGVLNRWCAMVNASAFSDEVKKKLDSLVLELSNECEFGKEFTIIDNASVSSLFNIPADDRVTYKRKYTILTGLCNTGYIVKSKSKGLVSYTLKIDV